MHNPSSPAYRSPNTVKPEALLQQHRSCSCSVSGNKCGVFSGSRVEKSGRIVLPEQATHTEPNPSLYQQPQLCVPVAATPTHAHLLCGCCWNQTDARGPTACSTTSRAEPRCSRGSRARCTLGVCLTEGFLPGREFLSFQLISRTCSCYGYS